MLLTLIMTSFCPLLCDVGAGTLQTSSAFPAHSMLSSSSSFHVKLFRRGGWEETRKRRKSSVLSEGFLSDYRSYEPHSNTSSIWKLEFLPVAAAESNLSFLQHLHS